MNRTQIGPLTIYKSRMYASLYLNLCRVMQVKRKAAMDDTEQIDNVLFIL